MSTEFIDADKALSEVVCLISSKARDVDALRHARELADSIRAEMKVKYGTVNVAVELIREVRDH